MKCKITNTIYHIEGKKTFCIISFDIISENAKPLDFDIIARGCSTCDNVDKFDPKTGMRIALAKAERKMYKIASKKIKKQLNILTKIEKEMIDFLPFAKEQIEHDTKHILSICDGTFKERKK